MIKIVGLFSCPIRDFSSVCKSTIKQTCNKLYYIELVYCLGVLDRPYNIKISQSAGGAFLEP